MHYVYCREYARVQLQLACNSVCRRVQNRDLGGDELASALRAQLALHCSHISARFHVARHRRRDLIVLHGAFADLPNAEDAHDVSFIRPSFLPVPNAHAPSDRTPCMPHDGVHFGGHGVPTTLCTMRCEPAAVASSIPALAVLPVPRPSSRRIVPAGTLGYLAARHGVYITDLVPGAFLAPWTQSMLTNRDFQVAHRTITTRWRSAGNSSKPGTHLQRQKNTSALRPRCSLECAMAPGESTLPYS